MLYRIVIGFFLSAILGGCSQYYLSVCQQWVDVRYLASSHVKTPDPRQEHPPLGQMLILDWRVPKEILDKSPTLILDLILWDYSTREVKFPIKNKMSYVTFKLFDEEYEKSGGILTYQARIVTDDGQTYREWKHQLFVNLITVD